jgi:parvulin-like peptidyl-prolyl isomerase
MAVSSCGGNAPPAQNATNAAGEPSASPPRTQASASEVAAKGPDKAAVEACLAAAKASRARFSGEPPKVGARHVLVKYKGAKNADPKITRTREEACLRAAEARDQVRNGADFAEVVRQFSEEAGADSRHGSIGVVERKDVAKPFADALFELSVNQLSDVVETEYGFHVIMRTE